ERDGQGVDLARQRVDIFLETGLQIGTLLFEGLNVVFGAPDVALLLDGATDSAGRGRGFANGGHREALPAEKRPGDGRACRGDGPPHRGMRLRSFAIDGLLGLSNALLECRQLGPELRAESLGLGVALLARGVLQTNAKVAFRFTGLRVLIEVRGVED